MNIEDTESHSDFQRREPRAGGLGSAYSPTPHFWFVVMHKQALGGGMTDGTVKHLISEGFEHYKPMFMRMKRRRVAGKRDTRLTPATEPLLPGYVFLRRVREGRTPITSLYGIEGGFQGGVTDDFIQALKAEEVDGFIQFVRKHDPSREDIAPGDLVETVDGFVRGMVEARDGAGRLSLMTRFLSGTARVTVGLTDVYRVERRAEPVRRDALAGKGRAAKAETSPKPGQSLKPGKEGGRFAQAADLPEGSGIRVAEMESLKEGQTLKPGRSLKPGKGGQAGSDAAVGGGAPSSPSSSSRSAA